MNKLLPLQGPLGIQQHHNQNSAMEQEPNINDLRSKDMQQCTYQNVQAYLTAELKNNPRFDINKPFHEGKTLLERAVEKKDLEAIKYLIAHGAQQCSEIYATLRLPDDKDILDYMALHTVRTDPLLTGDTLDRLLPPKFKKNGNATMTARELAQQRLTTFACPRPCPPIKVYLAVITAYKAQTLSTLEALVLLKSIILCMPNGIPENNKYKEPTKWINFVSAFIAYIETKGTEDPLYLPSEPLSSLLQDSKKANPYTPKRQVDQKNTDVNGRIHLENSPLLSCRHYAALVAMLGMQDVDRYLRDEATIRQCFKNVKDIETSFGDLFASTTPFLVQHDAAFFGKYLLDQFKQMKPGEIRTAIVSTITHVMILELAVISNEVTGTLKYVVRFHDINAGGQNSLSGPARYARQRTFSEKELQTWTLDQLMTEAEKYIPVLLGGSNSRVSAIHMLPSDFRSNKPLPISTIQTLNLDYMNNRKLLPIVIAHFMAAHDYAGLQKLIANFNTTTMSKELAQEWVTYMQRSTRKEDRDSNWHSTYSILGNKLLNIVFFQKKNSSEIVKLFRDFLDKIEQTQSKQTPSAIASFLHKILVSHALVGFLWLNRIQSALTSRKADSIRAFNQFLIDFEFHKLPPETKNEIKDVFLTTTVKDQKYTVLTSGIVDCILNNDIATMHALLLIFDTFELSTPEKKIILDGVLNSVTSELFSHELSKERLHGVSDPNFFLAIVSLIFTNASDSNQYLIKVLRLFLEKCNFSDKQRMLDDLFATSPMMESKFSKVPVLFVCLADALMHHKTEEIDLKQQQWRKNIMNAINALMNLLHDLEITHEDAQNRVIHWCLKMIPLTDSLGFERDLLIQSLSKIGNIDSINQQLTQADMERAARQQKKAQQQIPPSLKRKKDDHEQDDHELEKETGNEIQKKIKPN